MANNIPGECHSVRLGLVASFCLSKVQVHKGAHMHKFDVESRGNSEISA